MCPGDARVLLPSVRPTPADKQPGTTPAADTFKLHFLRASYAWALALDALEKTEREQGWRYDFVIKLRPDEQICKPLPPWRQFAGDARYANMVATWPRNPFIGPEIHDHLALMRRDVASRYLSAHKELTEACAPHAEYYRRTLCHGFHGSKWRQAYDVPAECVLSRWLKRGGVTYDSYAKHPNGSYGGGILGDWNYCLWTGAVPKLATKVFSSSGTENASHGEARRQPYCHCQSCMPMTPCNKGCSCEKW